MLAPQVALQTLNASDWSRLRDIRLQALAESPNAFGSTLEREQRYSDEDWMQRLGRNDVVTMVAVAPVRKDVGLIVGCPYDECAGLFSMWIAPEWRGQGIGGLLVDAIIEWARQLGTSRILLDVGDWNTAALALYRSRGFLPTGKVGALPFPRDHIPEQQFSLLL